MIDCYINNNPVTGETFKAYLLNLKIKLLESEIENPVYVLDNARIYHYRGFVEVLNSEGIVLKYSLLYSPMLNIIENCFSKWKNFVVRSRVTFKDVLRQVIISKMKTITPANCDGFFRKMLRVVEKSRKREQINE
ncbi:hypothetical protein CDIK_3708 [Cucumispora dikerogammari]|nr:hypothetical protein CDIK_3708 [Cucumispora dikerogammari]